MVINLGLHTMQLPEKHTSHSHLALHTQCFFHKPCAGAPSPWLLHDWAASSKAFSIFSVHAQGKANKDHLQSTPLRWDGLVVRETREAHS